MNEFRDRETGETKFRAELLAAFHGLLPKTWTSATFDALNVDPVLPTPQPESESPLRIVRRAGATQDTNGNWVQAWEEIHRHEDDEESTKAEKDAAYLAELQAATLQKVVDEIKRRTQERLDAFAQTRDYNDAASCASYATSRKAQWAAEGQYIIDARDNTWEVLLQIFSDIQASLRSMPSGYGEIESELPALEWPNV